MLQDQQHTLNLEERYGTWSLNPFIFLLGVLIKGGTSITPKLPLNEIRNFPLHFIIYKSVCHLRMNNHLNTHFFWNSFATCFHRNAINDLEMKNHENERGQWEASLCARLSKNIKFKLRYQDNYSCYLKNC